MRLFTEDQASASPMFADQEELESFYMVEFNQALPGLTQTSSEIADATVSEGFPATLTEAAEEINTKIDALEL